MKCLFKQACELEGQKFGPDMRKKPGTFNVPGYFVFLSYFVALFKDEKIKILEVSDKDIKEMEEASKSERFKDEEPCEEIISVIESLMAVKEETDEEVDDMVNGGVPSSTDESQQSQEQKADEVQGEQVQSQQTEEVKTEAPVETPVSEAKLSKEEAEELAILEEKKLRLTNKEKKRHQELLEKLKG